MDSTLSVFNDRLAKVHLRGQWTAEINLQRAVDGPLPKGVPYVWRYAEVMQYLLEACAAFPDVLHARRALTFDNPALDRYTTHTLAAGLQLIQPDELAWPHRHSASALRFVVDGDPNLVTVVNGVTHPMQNYDLILTPNWSWHAHQNRSSKNTTWLDLLDVPLVGALNQTFFEPGEQGRMDAGKEAAVAREFMHFPWTQMKQKLDERAARGESDPFDGVTCDYSDPRTGGPTMATVSCHAHRLAAGLQTESHRHTSSAIYFVIEGEGRTMVGDTELTWGKHDTFCIPNWSWHHHENLTKGAAAYLFSIDDSPVLDALKLMRTSTQTGH